MSEQINSGGPAFPVQDAASWQAHGMTLRDYAAIHADMSRFEFMNMEAAAAFVGRPLPEDTAGQLAWQADLVAKVRYMHADAMLAARGDA